MVGGDTHGMGHHGWGNPRGNETSEVRWVGRDTIDETGTSGGRQTLHAEIAVLPELTLFLETCPLYMFPSPPPTRFQSPHLTENTCHEKSDFYIIIMIIIYLL